MIILKNVSKAFDGKKLYENVNLTIEDGEFVCFSGPSGCGKTTLLNIIGGLENADRGEVIVNGKNLCKRSDRFQFYREDAGYVFQNFALVERKTVQQNLELIPKASRADCPIDEALSFVGLSDKKDQKVYQLSGGEQQRIAIARLLIKQCTIVLADEPTGSLDADNAAKVVELLQKLNQMGKTVVLGTHSEDVRNAAKRLIPLESLR